MFELTLQGEEEALGPEHQDTVSTSFHLAKMYNNLERYEHCEKMYVRALVGYERYQGVESESALNTHYNMALCYKNMGNYKSAASSYRRAMEGYEKVHGPNHEETLEAMEKTGDCLVLAEYKVIAVDFYQTALQRRSEALGAESDATKRWQRSFQSFNRDLC